MKTSKIMHQSACLTAYLLIAGAGAIVIKKGAAALGVKDLALRAIRSDLFKAPLLSGACAGGARLVSAKCNHHVVKKLCPENNGDLAAVTYLGTHIAITFLVTSPFFCMARKHFSSPLTMRGALGYAAINTIATVALLLKGEDGLTESIKNTIMSFRPPSDRPPLDKEQIKAFWDKKEGEQSDTDYFHLKHGAFTAAQSAQLLDTLEDPIDCLDSLKDKDLATKIFCNLSKSTQIKINENFKKLSKIIGDNILKYLPDTPFTPEEIQAFYSMNKQAQRSFIVDNQFLHNDAQIAQLIQSLDDAAHFINKLWRDTKKFQEDTLRCAGIFLALPSDKKDLKRLNSTIQSLLSFAEQQKIDPTYHLYTTGNSVDWTQVIAQGAVFGAAGAMATALALLRVKHFIAFDQRFPRVSEIFPTACALGTSYFAARTLVHCTKEKHGIQGLQKKMLSLTAAAFFATLIAPHVSKPFFKNRISYRTAAIDALMGGIATSILFYLQHQS